MSNLTNSHKKKLKFCIFTPSRHLHTSLTYVQTLLKRFLHITIVCNIHHRKNQSAEQISQMFSSSHKLSHLTPQSIKFRQKFTLKPHFMWSPFFVWVICTNFILNRNKVSFFIILIVVYVINIIYSRPYWTCFDIQIKKIVSIHSCAILAKCQTPSI